MIKVKVPIYRDDEGQIHFEEWDKEWVPMMPMSHYWADELAGVAIHRVIWNGLSVPRIDQPNLGEFLACEDPAIYDGTYPYNGDELIVIPAMKIPAVPGIVYGISIAGTVYGVSATVASIAVSMAISLAVSTLISFLTAPAKPKGQGMSNSATSYGWQGIQNSYGPGDPIPVIFGTHRVGVKVVHYEIEEEYIYGKNKKIDLTKTKSWLKMLGCLGQGEIKSISEVQLNRNPVENYGDDVTVEKRYGLTSPTYPFSAPIAQPAIKGFEKNKTTYQWGREIPLTKRYEHNHKIYQGQFVLPPKGDPADNHVVYECMERGQMDAPAGAWPTGPLNTDFEAGVTFRIRDDATNRAVYTTSASNCTGFQIHFEFPGGLYANSTKSGQIPNSVSLQIEHRVSGTEFWEDDGIDVISANKTSMCRCSKRVDGLAKNRYDIRVTKVDAKYYTDGTQAGDVTCVHVVHWSKITEIKPWGKTITAATNANPVVITAPCHGMNIACAVTLAGFTGAWTACNGDFTATPITSDTFSIPVNSSGLGAMVGSPELIREPTYDGYAMVGVIVQASSQVSDSPPTLTALVEGLKMPVRSGGAWVKDWSDNPMYISRVIALNTKWGFGPWHTDPEVDSVNGDLDDATLITAAGYMSVLVNGKRRHTCNFVWDQRRKFLPMWQDVLGAARVMFFKAGGKWMFIYDHAGISPTQLFTMGNIVKDSVRVEWIEERMNYNAYDASFLSAYHDYEPYPFRAALRDMYDDETAQVKPKTLSVFGITDGDEAYRACKYLLNIAKFLHESVTFRVGLDGVACIPGDIFAFTHEMITGSVASGRVPYMATPLTQWQIAFDTEVTVSSGYEVTIRYSGGANPDVIEKRTITSSGTFAAGTALSVSSPFTQAPTQYDVYSVGAVGYVTKNYKLLEVDDSPDNTVTLKGLEYVADVYDDSGTLSQASPGYTPTYPVPPNPVLSVDVTEEVTYVDNKQQNVNLHIHWPVPEPTSGSGAYAGGHLYYGSPVIGQALSEFAFADWTLEGSGSIAENKTFGQFKKDQSLKVTTITSGLAIARATVSPVDMSNTGTHAHLGVNLFIDNIQNVDYVEVQLRSASNAYFYARKLKAALVSGWNFILASREDLDGSKLGGPVWTNINAMGVAVQATSGKIAIVSFDNGYFYGDFGWTYRERVEGSSTRWPNVNKGEVFLFKVNSFSTSNAECLIPGYGGIYVTAYDTEAPAVPVIEVFRAEGRVLTCQVRQPTESDFAGFEFHFKKTDAEFTPQPDEALPDCTLFKKMGSNVCSYTVQDTGDWSVKVRSYDQASNWNAIAGAYIPNYSAYCAVRTVNVSGIITKNTDPPNVVLAEYCQAEVFMIKKSKKTHGTIRFSWEAVTDPNGDEVIYQLDWWYKTTEDEYKSNKKMVRKWKGVNPNVTIKNFDVGDPDIPNDVIVCWTVTAIDTWGNKAEWLGSPIETPVTDTSPPTVIGVVTAFTATQKKGRVKLAWTATAANINTYVPDFKEWVILREVKGDLPPNIALAEEIAVRHKAARAYNDKDVEDDQDYNYWLKIRDQSLNLSTTYFGPATERAIGVLGRDVTAPSVVPVITAFDLTRQSDNTKYYLEAEVSFYGSLDETDLEGYNIEIWRGHWDSGGKRVATHKEDTLTDTNDETTVLHTVVIKGHWKVKDTSGSTYDYFPRVQAYDKRKNKTAWGVLGATSNPAGPPPAPVWHAAPWSTNGLTITVRVAETHEGGVNPPSDLGGFKWYFAKDDPAVPRNATTLKGTGSKLRTFTWTAPEYGKWYCDVECYDTEDPVNPSDSAGVLTTIPTLAAGMVNDSAAPVAPVVLAPTSYKAYKLKGHPYYKTKLVWTHSGKDVAPYTDKDVTFEVRLWLNSDTQEQARVWTTKKLNINVDELEGGYVYVAAVYAIDFQNNYSPSSNEMLVSATEQVNPIPVGSTLKCLLHFDGTQPYSTDFTGEVVDANGLAPTVRRGVIFRPGKFGKAIQSAPNTYNLCPNPRFAYGSVSGDTGKWNIPSPGPYNQATMSYVTTDVPVGTRALRVGIAAVGYDAYVNMPIPSIPSSWVSYALSFWARAPAGGSPMATCILRYGGVSDLTVSLSGMTNAWKRFGAGVTWPSAPASLQVYLRPCNELASYLEYSGVQVEPWPFPTPYVDYGFPGDVAWGTGWEGYTYRDLFQIKYDASKARPSGKQFSIGAWIYKEFIQAGSVPPWSMICEYNNGNWGAGTGVAFVYDWPTQGQFGGWLLANNSGGGFVSAGGAVLPGRWNHCVFTYDGSVVRTYVNGALSNTSNVGALTPAFDYTYLTVACRDINSGVTGPLNGYMDDFFVADRALTLEEIQQIYNSPTALVDIGSPVPDKLPPSIPQNLRRLTDPAPDTLSAGLFEVTVAWDASTDTSGSTVKYQLRWRKSGGAWHTSEITSETQYTLHDLKRGATYVWTVKAVDEAGNWSAENSEVSFTVGNTIEIPAGPWYQIGLDEDTENKYDYYIEFWWWTLGTGYDYQLEWWYSAPTAGMKHKVRVADDNVAGGEGAMFHTRVGGIKAGTTVTWHVCGIDSYGHKGANCGDIPVTIPTPPVDLSGCSATLSAKKDRFVIKVQMGANTAKHVKTIRVYVNDNSGYDPAHIIHEGGNKEKSITVKKGEATFDGAHTLITNRFYWFWVAFVPTDGTALPGPPTNPILPVCAARGGSNYDGMNISEFLEQFSLPWTMKNLTSQSVQRVAGYSGDSPTLWVGAGRVGMIGQYGIKGDGASYGLLDSIIYNAGAYYGQIDIDATQGAATFGPSECAGMILDAYSGVFVRGYGTEEDTNVTLLTWDAESGVQAVAFFVGDTNDYTGMGTYRYTIPAGKTLVITWMTAIQYPGNRHLWLYKSYGGGVYQRLYDAGKNKWMGGSSVIKISAVSSYITLGSNGGQWRYVYCMGYLIDNVVDTYS